MIAEVSTGPTRYRMLETVRRHAAASADNGEALRLRHATWFTERAEEADAAVRTPAEREGHETIGARVDEAAGRAPVTRSRRRRLATRLTAALQAPPTAGLWAEPAQWAAELARIIDEDEPLACPFVGGDGERGSPPRRFEEGTSWAERAACGRGSRAAAACRVQRRSPTSPYVSGRPVPLPEWDVGSGTSAGVPVMTMRCPGPLTRRSPGLRR